MEKWKPVPGYEGLYSVSSEGRVRSDARRIEDSLPGRPFRELAARPLRTHLRSGYPSVTLYRHGKGKKYRVHRLVALAFHGSPPPGKPHVSHVDENRINCRASNLEWSSQRRNNQYAWEQRRARGSRGFATKLEKIPEAELPTIRARVGAGETQAAVARDYGVHPATVSGIVRGKARRF